MYTDVWKTLRMYTNILVNVIINSSINLFLEMHWFPPLNNSSTKVHYHLINLSLPKIQVQGKHFINSWCIDFFLNGIILLGADKWKHKAIISGNELWSIISKFPGNKKINKQVKEALYNWILHYLQVVWSMIANCFLYIFIDGIPKNK